MELNRFPAYDQSVSDGYVTMADSAKRVIVGVDDDAHIRESYQSLLESAGFVPIMFPSAEEFLRSEKLYEANCLVTDIRMPGMDGIELQRRVKLLRPQLSVIFVSGHFDDETRGNAIAGGAFFLIDKPVDPRTLLETIHRAITIPEGGQVGPETVRSS